MDPTGWFFTAIAASASVASFLHALYGTIKRLRQRKIKRSASGPGERHGGEAVSQVSDLDKASPAQARPSASSALRREHLSWNRIEAWGRNYPVALSLILGFIFLGLTILLADSSAGSRQGPTGLITSPEDREVVPYQVRIEGTSKEVPLDTSPWLFVEANNGYLYPQGGSVGNTVEINRATGSWCGYAFFGEDDGRSAGKSYSLILALPTDKADQRLQRELERGPPVPHWRNLPQGFNQLAPVITVSRLAGAGRVDHGSCRR